MADEQRVLASEILKSAGSVHEGTYLQRTGLRLAAAVGATAVVVIFGLESAGGSLQLPFSRRMRTLPRSR